MASGDRLGHVDTHAGEIAGVALCEREFQNECSQGFIYIVEKISGGKYC